MTLRCRKSVDRLPPERPPGRKAEGSALVADPWQGWRYRRARNAELQCPMA